jgi:hypothetical protein
MEKDQITINRGDLVVIPQDANIYKVDFWDTYYKVFAYDNIKNKPELAIFIKTCYDDYCEVAIGDKIVIVEYKDIYKAEGTKYVS